MKRPAPPGPASDPGYPALKAQVIARTGQHYYADKDDLLYDRLRKRFKACGLPSSETYRALLGHTETGPAEWEALEAEITIGETFFFRYAEQFTALRDSILPGLIAARQTERRLRIWSAGCSTGAEPYSIAILLHELLGEELPDWRVEITGTDISAPALQIARAAQYGRWALRTTPAVDRARYFLVGPGTAGPTRDGTYTLRPEFRRMVRFERQNLMGLLDGSLAAPAAGFDLILCRNVLIYFKEEAVLGIVRGLGRRLVPDGWLLLGHAEPNPAFAGWLTPVNLPGTVAYRRTEDRRPAPLPAPSAPPVLMPAASLPRPLPDFRPPPVRAATPVPTEDVVPLGDIHARIRALADSGETGEAWRAVRAALTEAPTDATLHYYEGLLARALGREAEAERAFRGAIYLDRAFVMAHYQLGLLLAAEGRGTEASRALDNAIRLSQALPPDAPIAEGDGATARQLAEGAALARVRRRRA
jgi:chemotaxis protein methyltransferase CheR